MGGVAAPDPTLARWLKAEGYGNLVEPLAVFGWDELRGELEAGRRSQLLSRFDKLGVPLADRMPLLSALARAERPSAVDGEEREGGAGAAAPQPSPPAGGGRAVGSAAVAEAEHVAAQGVEALTASLASMVALLAERDEEVRDLKLELRRANDRAAHLQAKLSEAYAQRADKMMDVALAASTQAIQMAWDQDEVREDLRGRAAGGQQHGGDGAEPGLGARLLELRSEADEGLDGIDGFGRSSLQLEFARAERS